MIHFAVCACVSTCVCQTTVVSVRQRPDFLVSGQWEVETEKREGQRETQVFDAVMVCTGHFTQPHLPLNDFPGNCQLSVAIIVPGDFVYCPFICFIYYHWRYIDSNPNHILPTYIHYHVYIPVIALTTYNLNNMLDCHH